MRSLLIKPKVGYSLLLASLVITTTEGFAAERLSSPPALSAEEILLDGDIIIRQKATERSKRAAPSITASLWPQNTVYYSVAKANARTVVAFNEAKQYLESNTAVRLKERTTETAYVDISSEPLKKGLCGNSHLGKTRGAQPLRIAPTEECESRGVILHELLHALGVGHEHQRPDRDNYVGVESHSSIDPKLDTRAPYDFESVMHYYFSLPKTHDPSKQRLIRKTHEIVELSAGDIDTLYKLYPDPEATSPNSAPKFRAASLSHSILPLQAGASEGYLANIVTVYPGSRQDLANVSIVASPGRVLWRANSQPDGAWQVAIWPEAGFIGRSEVTFTLHFTTGEPQTLTLPIEVVEAAKEAPLMPAEQRIWAGKEATITLPPQHRLHKVSEVQGSSKVSWRQVEQDGQSQLVFTPIAGRLGKEVVKMKLHFKSGTTQTLEAPFEVLGALHVLPAIDFAQEITLIAGNPQWEAWRFTFPAGFRAAHASAVRTEGIEWQQHPSMYRNTDWQVNLRAPKGFVGSTASVQLRFYSDQGEVQPVNISKVKVCRIVEQPDPDGFWVSTTVCGLQK